MVSASSDSQLSFSVSELGPPPVALLEEFALRVGNRGHALVAVADDADRRFALLPVLSDLSPYRGSLGGGTLVTLTGSGLAPSTADVVVSRAPSSPHPLGVNDSPPTSPPPRSE